ncbi:MAG: protein kinase [Thermoguttaceae bacterium]|jgi:serine/threonine protein kinase|nr:protein kinase [Thermoguttaceae bacterium]
MSISTAKQFVAVLQKSRLLKPKHLDAVRIAAENDPDPKALAGRLVKKELLSRWQAKQLLAGHASFFLGEYRLIQPLSAHSGSHVYLAEHKTLGRRVALKRLPRDVMSDADRKKRLLGAVRAAVGVEHENLARVYSIEQVGDRYYVISQYVEGRDLAATVAEDGPLGFAEAATAVSQAASGLAESHRRKAAHGGVRPSNLIIGPDGQVKLVAIATARRYEATEETGADGDTPAALDAVDYQAPELLKADVSPAPASDIYSLGCTLYFLLTGKPPFAEGTAAERAAEHARHQPPGILRSRPDTPDLLVKACRKMLAKRPEDRPDSADEVVEMLAELCPAKPATRIVATVSARASKEETAKGKEEKEAARSDQDDVKSPAEEDSPSAASEPSPEVELEQMPSDAPDDESEGGKICSAPPKKDRKSGPEAKSPDRRQPGKAAPAAAKPTAKPAARRPPARGAAAEREGKVPGKPPGRESSSPKSGAAFAVETGGADSPVAQAKSRAGKAVPDEDKAEEDEAAAAGPEGFLKTHRKWIFIGGGSAAALLLVVVATLLLVLGGSAGDQTGVETAAANGDKPADTASGQPARAGQPDIVEELDLGAELDLDMDLGIDDTPVRRPRDPEPDEKPETPAEDEQGAEEKEPSGEKDDAKPDDTEKKPESGGEKPDEPKEKPPEEAKPDEPKEKPSEEAKPDEPKEKPAPPKKEKPPTFRDFPDTVELPPLAAAEGQPAPTEPITIGKLYVRERAPWIVVLSGGEVVVPNAEITINREATEGGGRGYIVQLTPKGEAGTAIARFWFEPEPGQLKFQWLEPAMTTQGAGLLRLCHVNLDIDGESKTLAFSKPAPAPPLEFDLDKKIDRVTIDTEDLPDDKLLRLEITKIEGLDPKNHPFQTKPDGPIEVKKPLALALQRMDRDRNPRPIALLQITFAAARKGLTITRRIDQPPRRMPLPGPPEMLRQQGEAEFKKNTDQLKKAQGSAERDKFRPILDKIEEGFGYLDLIELVDKQAKIHYRILLQAGNHAVPLYDSQVEGPAGSEPAQ